MHTLRYRMRAPCAYSRSVGSNALVNLRTGWRKCYLFSMARPDHRCPRSLMTRILSAALAIVAMLAGTGFGAVYGISEWKMLRPNEAPIVPLRATTAPDLAEGERMARIVGCWDGCHGRTGQGGHEEIRGIIRNTAPTLSQ